MFRSLRRSLSRLTAAGIALACASSAFAMPVTLSAGQSAGFNFNFVGENPPPPYEKLRTDFVFSDTAVGDSWRMVWYEDPDLQGGAVTTWTVVGDLPTFSDTFFDNAQTQGLMDGIFSVNVTVLAGSITLETLTSIGFDSREPGALETGPQLPTPIETTPPPNGVPEPTSGALALLALATAGALSRRRRAA
jgi:MYXO-CTERM domain-containing protein